MRKLRLDWSDYVPCSAGKWQSWDPILGHLPRAYALSIPWHPRPTTLASGVSNGNMVLVSSGLKEEDAHIVLSRGTEATKVNTWTNRVRSLVSHSLYQLRRCVLGGLNQGLKKIWSPSLHLSIKNSHQHDEGGKFPFLSGKNQLVLEQIGVHHPQWGIHLQISGRMWVWESWWTVSLNIQAPILRTEIRYRLPSMLITISKQCQYTDWKQMEAQLCFQARPPHGPITRCLLGILVWLCLWWMITLVRCTLF